MGDSRCACKILVGIPDARRTLGRHMSRWEDDIKIDLQDVEWWHVLD
jgi:hypothetical protein